jgi:Mg-chelatase subunit ChlD
MADVLELISRTVGAPDENLSIFSFAASQPALLCAGNCRSSHALERIPAAGARGLTPLYDTIVFATDYLASRGDVHAEKVLIVFSDGLDTISRNALGDVVKAALSSEVELDCIDLIKPAYRSQGAAALRSLAATTGGRYFPAPGGAAQALNVILEGLRASYLISYRLPNHASGFHTVRILPTHNLNLQFRSRSGYFYPNRAW